ncbi:MAG TPA: hypothetical protein P5290_00905 [Candidatus Methanomethylicus sp.]|nr:hypothetical protein [Candidatus Methanomethylicus sp.]
MAASILATFYLAAESFIAARATTKTSFMMQRPMRPSSRGRGGGPKRLF